MKFIFATVILLLLLQQSACVSPLNCRKQFTYFSEPLNIPAKYNAIFSGIYVSIDGKGAYCFYENGLTKYIPSNVDENCDLWENPGVEIYNLIDHNAYYARELWGEFQIVSDTIIIQDFGIHNDQLCRRAVYKEKIVINDDSTFIWLSNYSYWFKSEVMLHPSTFRLYKTDCKPDSSLAWFINKGWYKKNLHPTRE